MSDKLNWILRFSESNYVLPHSNTDNDMVIDSGTALSIDTSHNRKRKLQDGQSADSDEENNAPAPPVHDLYRLRQQMKAKWRLFKYFIIDGCENQTVFKITPSI